MTVSSLSEATSDSPREVAPSIKQVIEGRYIDREKLIHFLNKTFGEGKFAVRLQLNRWILSIPQKLTEEQIESCSME